MLKYAVIFCIISYCNSVPRAKNSYTTLIFVQHFPITSFFLTQVSYGNVNISSTEFAEYLRDHWIIFEDQKWVIHGLRALNVHNRYLTNCLNSLGFSPVYDDNNLSPYLKRKLKSKWPVLNLNRTEQSLWETEYNVYGSCVKENAELYFWEALHLLEKYDIEFILRRSEIVQGNTYELRDIVASITNALGVQVYVKCLPSLKTRAQYLLEVQLCFNSRHRLVNCEHRVLFPGAIPCNSDVPIIYSKTP